LSDKHNSETSAVVRRLDAVLAILLELIDEESKKASITRRITLLHLSGLKPSEIARIVGKTSVYVNVVIGRQRSPKKRK
jgi:hypothetical protein